MELKSKHEKAAHNMGLSAIPATEYILIDISLLDVGSNPSKITGALEYKLIDISLLSDRPSSSNTDYRHSRKACTLAAILMETFVTKYNYLIFALRSLFFLFFVGLLIGFFAYS